MSFLFVNIRRTIKVAMCFFFRKINIGILALFYILKGLLLCSGVPN